MRVSIPIFLLILVIIGLCSAGNVTVYEVGAEYIVWSTDGNITHFYLDGNDIPVYSSKYVQSGLTPGSTHIGCEENSTCVGVTTPINGISVFLFWLVYLIGIGICIASYYVPVTSMPSIVYGLFAIRYVNDLNLGFTYMSLAAIIMIASVIAAVAGWRR